MRRCEILYKDKRAGILTEKDDMTYEFQYLPEYLESAYAEPIAFRMPLQQEPYTSDYLFPVFFNMLSEGANREAQSKYLGIPINDDFGIMLATAQYDTIGAITVRPI